MNGAPSSPEPLRMDELIARLEAIDGLGYGAYRRLQGVYSWFGRGRRRFTLGIDHVQADPFAPPSRARIRMPLPDTGWPRELVTSRDRRIGLGDYLARSLSEAIRDDPSARDALSIDAGGQEILERSATRVTEEWLEARIEIRLPASGRRILSSRAQTILTEAVERVATRALVCGETPERAWKHVRSLENHRSIQDQLLAPGLIAFIANGSILPRASGRDDRPLDPATAFHSPVSLEVEMRLVDGRCVRGMGLPRGVSLIAGGGYHGKTTLLKAIELGVYPHVPEDGRELVVTDPDTVKIRAENGRRVDAVDISPFIGNLPNTVPTTAFSTLNASGATSQAANTIEALEQGARVLLLDEDTSASNFMFRDRRMRSLVPDEEEPITPYIERVSDLFRRHAVSTVMVMGGSGEYFELADLVLRMKDYQTIDVSAEAEAISRRIPRAALGGDLSAFETIPHRRIASVVRPDRKPGRRRRRTAVAKGKTIRLSTSSAVDLSVLDQLIDESQVRAIAELVSSILAAPRDDLMYSLLRHASLDSFRAFTDSLEDHLDRYGLDGLGVLHSLPGPREPAKPTSPKDSGKPDRREDAGPDGLHAPQDWTGRSMGRHPGRLARPRRYELAAALARLSDIRFGSASRREERAKAIRDQETDVPPSETDD